MRTWKSISTLALAWLLASCAMTSPGGPGDTGPEVSKETRVTIEQGPRSLSETIRAVGARYGGNVVAMHGIGLEAVPALSLTDVAENQYVETLARETDTMLHDAGRYGFLYPDERYASLLGLDLEDQLPPSFGEIRVSLALGDGTKLFNALAMLSNSLGISLVADNAVADARCGELILTDVPLRACLEALFQSARIAPEAFDVVVGDAYALFVVQGRTLPASYLIGAEPASGSTAASALSAPVRLVLPRFVPADAALPAYDGARPLREVLPTLSSQLGVTVRTRGDAADLPVNPAVLSGVTGREALDLLVAQWLTTDYGYAVEGDEIVIRPVR